MNQVITAKQDKSNSDENYRDLNAKTLFGGSKYFTNPKAIKIIKKEEMNLTEPRIEFALVLLIIIIITIMAAITVWRKRGKPERRDEIELADRKSYSHGLSRIKTQLEEVQLETALLQGNYRSIIHSMEKIGRENNAKTVELEEIRSEIKKIEEASCGLR